MKKIVLLLLCIAFLSSCDNQKGKNLVTENSTEVATEETTEEVNDNTSPKIQIKEFVDSIISSDPNSLNNNLTKEKLEKKISAELKKLIPANVNIISDIPLKVYGVDESGALFNQSIQLDSYPEMRFDIEIFALASEEEKAKLKDGNYYYLKNSTFVEFTYSWSMDITKDALRTDEVTDKRRINFSFTVKDPSFVEVK